MTTRTIGCDTADGLSRAVRRIALDHALDPALRGRLVLSVAAVAEPALHEAVHTSLSWTFQCEDDDRSGLLTLALGLDGPAVLPSAEAAAALPP